MIIIPAIDIRGGNCVRLTQGRLEDETIYSKDPLLVAKLWQAQGAKRLHLIDLDGAFSGKIKNKELIFKIIKELDIPVQVGGGIRDYETGKKLISAGAHRIIIGTSAIYDIEFLKSLIKKWPEKITVGIDSSSGKVAIGGWRNITTRWAGSLAEEMESLGVREIIITDIKKDGTLEGPNIKWIEKIAKKVNIPVIASGGISNIEDIKKLRDLKLQNLLGVIVGKALYSDGIMLQEAIKVAESYNNET